MAKGVGSHWRALVVMPWYIAGVISWAGGKRKGRYLVKHFTRAMLLTLEYSVDAGARDRSMEALRRGDPRLPLSRSAPAVSPSEHPFKHEPLSQFLRWTLDNLDHCKPILKMKGSELASMYNFPCSLLPCVLCMTQGTMKKKMKCGVGAAKERVEMVDDDSDLRALLAAEVSDLIYLKRLCVKSSMGMQLEENAMDADRFAPQPACIVKYLKSGGRGGQRADAQHPAVSQRCVGQALYELLCWRNCCDFAMGDKNIRRLLA